MREENKMDKADKIIAFENGSLSDDDTITLFQELIDSGEVWSLQGSYRRMAHGLILGGYCHVRPPIISKVK